MASKGISYRALHHYYPWICTLYLAAWMVLVIRNASTTLEQKSSLTYKLRFHKVQELRSTTNSVAAVLNNTRCEMRRRLDVNSEICEFIVGKKDHRNILGTKRRHSLRQREHHFGNYRKEVDYGCDITTISKNCLDVRKSYLFGKDNVGFKETSFPLAFAIKLHANANQAHRLLRFIYREHNVYCIHIDKKTTAHMYEQFRNISKCLENIIVIEDRVSVVYSTIRQVEAELSCIDAMLKSKVTWQYYINLTGQESMLKTNAEIVEILKMLNGRNDIESYPMVDDAHKYKQKTIIVGQRAQITKLKKEPFHRNITIRKGSAYGLFSRSFLEFIKADSIAKELMQWLADTYAPEEMIWATLNALHNAPGGYNTSVTQKNKLFLSRAVIWSLDRQYSCRGKFVRWVCIYGLGDVPWLLGHRNIVANKFHEKFEPLALDCIERSMYRRLEEGNGIGEIFNATSYDDIINI